ncbi:hypothetical protein ACH4GK_20880 [Streptomyces rimosus]|uniref:hypothetical protein n=1 Tax=Streptomyces rimosus TaxID=1927 RepID=UPI0004C4A65D|nr:hypothetical protein [Streptomyces rimosus]
MKLMLTLMTVAGGLLPLMALIWGGLALRKDYVALVRDLDAIDRIIQAPEDAFETPQQRDAAMHAVREPTFNYGRLTYTYEWIQRLVWGQAMNDLRGPAWLAIAGLVLATAAGAWSLWV